MVGMTPNYYSFNRQCRLQRLSPLWLNLLILPLE